MEKSKKEMAKLMKRLAILVLAVCVLMCGATALASEEDEYLCTLYDDGVKVLAYYGSDTTVVIPETLSGYPVRRSMNSSASIPLRQTSKSSSFRIV